jgi:predicted RNA binding protein YcfA (HicA-like mRNA interferase family)
VKFAEIEAIIKRDGWVHIKSRGSHYQYTHPKKNGKVTIPYHGGDIAPVIIKSILRQAGL